jgi:predicted nucleic acid-binding protein
MTTLTIQLAETDYQRLERAAKHAGKAIQALIYEWIAKLPETDCTSFVVMRQLNLMEAFTNDHHFAQMGFVVHLKS